MEVPSGWVRILRGPRPKSEQWPKQSKSIFKGYGRGQQRQSSVSPPQTRHDPDSVMSNARSRIAKLEAAMVAVGESDPTYPSLFDALQKARALAEVQPVQDRIASTESIITRARKRVETERGCGDSEGGARQGRSEIGFRGVEQGRAPSRGIATGSEDCASVNTILSGSEQSASRRGGRVQEDAGSHRIPPAGALSIEVGAI